MKRYRIKVFAEYISYEWNYERVYDSVAETYDDAILQIIHKIENLNLKNVKFENTLDSLPLPVTVNRLLNSKWELIELRLYEDFIKNLITEFIGACNGKIDYNKITELKIYRSHLEKYFYKYSWNDVPICICTWTRENENNEEYFIFPNINIMDIIGNIISRIEPYNGYKIPVNFDEPIIEWEYEYDPEDSR